MKRLRYSAVALIFFLAVLFNLERLDFGAENLIDIHSFVYVLALGAVLAVVGLRSLQRLPIWAQIGVWLLAYFAAKLLIFDGRPFVGGIYTYLTITELVLLLAVVRLAQQFAQHIADFEQAVEHITLADNNGAVYTVETAQHSIKNEMLRSRRYDRALSVIVVEPEPGSIRAALHRTIQEVQRAMMSRYVFTGLARRIRHDLRRIDLVLEQRDRGRIIVVSPETKTGEAELLMERIKSSAAEQLGVSVQCGAATFPDEAVTFEELVSQAAERIADNDPSRRRGVSTESQLRADLEFNLEELRLTEKSDR